MLEDSQLPDAYAQLYALAAADDPTLILPSPTTGPSDEGTQQLQDISSHRLTLCFEFQLYDGVHAMHINILMV